METDTELRVKDIFDSLKRDKVTPHPFLKTRVLATSRDLMRAKKKIFYWKFISIFSMACLVLSLFYHTKISQTPTIALNEPYVIHMHFSEEEASFVAFAEIDLPKGVSFHSKRNPQIREARKLRLPVRISSDGRTKLPFVVVANGKGTKKIHVRLFDWDNNPIKEDFIKVSFDRKS